MDKILNDLSFKKKELLSKLLSRSQQYELSGKEALLLAKESLLCDLEKNDLAIEIREAQTGLKAEEVAPKAFSDIKYLLETLKDLNQTAIFKLEQEQVELQQEKESLNKAAQVKGYFRSDKRQKGLKPGKGAAHAQIGRQFFAGKAYAQGAKP